MRYYSIDITLQEVPGEISISFSICGCNIQCKGCHSPFLWKEDNGYLLDEKTFISTLKKYLGFASCVLFMGGEWHPKDIQNYLKIAQTLGYNTCLYTGKKSIPKEISKHLTWLKTGPWVEKLGSLSSPHTNQKFIEVKTQKTLNHLFQKINYDTSKL